jgi:hypothetical protein
VVPTVPAAWATAVAASSEAATAAQRSERCIVEISSNVKIDDGGDSCTVA